MSDDLINRLLGTPLYEGHGEPSDIPEQAADEITRLRARLEQAERSRGSWIKAAVEQGKTIKRLRAAFTDRHPDDKAVDRFADTMKAKLAKKRAAGRGGWEGPECSAEFLSKLLREHVEKGDPVDVGNLAMMIHQRGERIATSTDTTPSVAEAAQVILEVDLLPFDMDMCDAIDETDGGLWIDGDRGACISSDAMINCVRAALTSLAAQTGGE